MKKGRVFFVMDKYVEWSVILGMYMSSVIEKDSVQIYILGLPNLLDWFVLNNQKMYNVLPGSSCIKAGHTPNGRSTRKIDFRRFV